MQQYSSQQPEMFGPYGAGGGGGGYMGPERRPVQGQYPYPYSRERQGGPPQHNIMGSGPVPVSGGPGEGPQGNMWHPRTEMGYTYSRQGQGPPYPGMNRGDDQEGRAPQDTQWPPSHPSQRQPPYPPHSSSSPSMPSLPSRQPLSSFQATPTVPNHVTRSHSPSSFPRPLGGSLSPNSAPYLPSMKKPGVPPGPSPTQGLPLIHREVIFPPGSVEGTLPKLKPRRRLTAKDTGQTPPTHTLSSLCRCDPRLSKSVICPIRNPGGVAVDDVTEVRPVSREHLGSGHHQHPAVRRRHRGLLQPHTGLFM